jgi:flagellar hook-basal body complex protein FliE
MTNPKIGGGSVVDRFARMNQSFSQRSRSQESRASGSAFPAVSTETQGSSKIADGAKGGLGAVESSVQRTNNIHLDVVKGDVDLHEVAAQLKESEITFQFALTVRNKLLDAYREVMRMSV